MQAHRESSVLGWLNADGCASPRGRTEQAKPPHVETRMTPPRSGRTGAVEWLRPLPEKGTDRGLAQRQCNGLQNRGRAFDSLTSCQTSHLPMGGKEAALGSSECSRSPAPRCVGMRLPHPRCLCPACKLSRVLLRPTSVPSDQKPPPGQGRAGCRKVHMRRWTRSNTLRHRLC